MPRFFGPLREYADAGSVVIERQSPHYADVIYIPSRERLQRSDVDSSSTSLPRARLLRIDVRNESLVIFPINTFPSAINPHGFLRQKYAQVNSITIQGWELIGSDLTRIVFPPAPERHDYAIEFEYSDQDEVMLTLEDLPSCFIKDYDHGLGFTKPYRFIIEAVELLSDCTSLVISRECETRIDPEDGEFYISIDDLEIVRKAIDRTVRHAQNAARSINYATTHNLFAAKTGHAFIPVKTGRSPLRKILTDAAIRSDDTLTQDEQDEMLDIFAKNTRSLAANKPRQLATLKTDIELVTIDTLIARFQELMGKRTTERLWQQFLNENSFILSLAFGYPIVKVCEQASMGGHTITGSGETIADYLVKNSLTNNCAIIEIKTAKTKLLNKSRYRGSVYSPSSYLVGAVNQALKQKNNFEREISRIKDNSRIYDIESFAVSCCLIVGSMPDDEEMKQSFELFRGNSKNVQIITFDELLLKLTNLRELLSSPPVETVSNSESLELPF